MNWRLLAALGSLGTVAILRAGARAPRDLPAYRPRTLEAPRAGSYLTADGAIAIVGYNDMQELMEAMDRLYIAAHPGFRFALDLRGTRLAPPALARGATALAPMGAEFTASQWRTYRATAPGSEPVAIRIAHASVSPRAKSGPLAILVNPANPVGRLTVAQVARMFSTADRGDELTTWGQAGANEAWSARPIHPVGLAVDTPLGESMLAQKMTGRRYRAVFQAEVQSEDVVRRVASDPLAIGFARANVVRPGVKVVAVAARPEDGYLTPSAAVVGAGRYPYDRFLYLYFRRTPGTPLEPFIREYLLLALSREGQEAVAATPQAYLPLTAREAAAERAKLDS